MTSHAMHANSLEAHRERGPKLTERQHTVLEWFRRHGKPATDRECMEALGYSDPNFVRPRITELVKDLGLLEECGKTKCPTYQTTVRLVRVTVIKTELKPTLQRLL